MPAIKRSPLLYRYLNWGDGENYQTLYVEEDLGTGFFLLRHVNMKTGDPLTACKVVHLGQVVSEEDNVVFYDDFESVANWGEDEKEEPVVRLVPRMP